MKKWMKIIFVAVVLVLVLVGLRRGEWIVALAGGLTLIGLWVRERGK